MWKNLAWSLMIIIQGVTHSSFKNQGVTSRSDNSHFQCVVSMIGIGYQIV